jgi:hypothetical protein
LFCSACYTVKGFSSDYARSAKTAFPNDEQSPSESLQLPYGLGITIQVFFKLVPPPGGARIGYLGKMASMVMPKTAMNEDRN